ncbi:HAD family hydrolase [Sphingomonas sp. So64.6b]|uniref:HAD family hydrolase n=1 Tax=Sphingomonas sp. So64.6b TaxID=2997354 RepID=UPI0015FF703D|nr:HAD family hydrolase [Sphingomonas sp. So64.6b]QNA86048.1 HAD family hydrolase [Sphingomonas sp. So64.6b]
MRPLLICDCDEVLLHMVRHFGVWLGETHEIDFSPNGGDFATSMKRRDGSPAPAREEMWAMLDQFFPAEMDRQTLVPHAREALAALSESADIVILTNLQDQCRQPRIEQLARFGIAHRVECNQGGKGGPVARLVAEHRSDGVDPVTVFVDDLAVHHDSVARHAPQVHRLHMISEPALAPNVPKAPAAHARIDDWIGAEAWIAERFAAGLPAE